LGNRIVELFGRRLSRQEFAAQFAALIADAVKTQAVVVLGYDRRRERLALLADHGLNDDARAALGAGGDCPWDIPLRGLRNRRISVIEAAHQNPFVPRALLSLSAGGLSIASLPIYYDHEPAGVLLLFAAGSRAFPDTQLQTLSQALRVCARGLREPEGSSPRAARTTAEGISADPLIPEMPEPVPITAPPAAAEQTGEPPPALHLVDTHEPRPEVSTEPTGSVAAPVEAEVARLRAELEFSAQNLRNLTSVGNARARERDGLAQQLDDIESIHAAEITELRAEVSALQERALAVDSERARYQRLAEERHTVSQRSITALAAERDAALERSRVADAAAAELRGTLTMVQTERQRLAAQAEMLTRQLRASQEAQERAQAWHLQERAAIEADRDGWKEDAASVRTQLAQRAESVATLDRDLRNVTVARDAATAQLQTAQAEIERFAALTEDLQHSAAQLEVARAAAVAETTSLRHALADERSRDRNLEQELHHDLEALRAEVGQLSAEALALRAELSDRDERLAERDNALAVLRQEHAAARQADANAQQTDAALRGEVTTLTARIEQHTAERRQLLDERAAVEAALAEERQRANDSAVTSATALAQTQTETAELRRRVESLTAESAGSSARLQRAGEEGRRLSHELDAANRRAHELSERLRQRDAAIETATTEHGQSTAQIAALTAQLQAAQEAVAQAQARHEQERATVSAERDEWKEQAAAAQAELGRGTEAAALRERDLDSARALRDTSAAELQAAQSEVERLTAWAGELRQVAAAAESARSGAVAENAALQGALGEERNARSETEQAFRAQLAAAQIQVQQLAGTGDRWRDEAAARTRELTERDERLAAVRSEIEALRRHSSDRGVLAGQATALGQKVVELEQLLAAARGEAGEAERRRAALAEQLDAVLQREAQAAAAAARKQTALQESVQRLREERRRRDVETASQGAEIDALRSTLTETQAAFAQLRTERDAAANEGQDTLRRLSDAQRRLDELTALLHEREAVVGAALSDRAQMAAQVETLRDALRAGQAAVTSATARFADEGAALQAERDRWKEQAAAVGDERDALAAQIGELQRAAAQLEAARTTALSECAALRQALKQESGSKRKNEQTLQTDLARANAQLQQAQNEIAGLSEQVAAGAAHADHLRDERATMERELAALVASTHADEQALHAARDQLAHTEQERARLDTALAATEQRLHDAETRHAAAFEQTSREAAVLGKQVKALTAARANLTEGLERAEQAQAAHAARVDSESHRAETLAKHCADLEESGAALEARRAGLDTQLGQARAEIEALRQQSADRGVLARQATELGRTVVALEQQLAALRGATAEAERGRAALAEELDAAQRQQAAAAATAAGEHSTLQQALERLAAERQQLETQHAARSAEIEAQRAALTELQAALEQERAARAQAEATAHTATQRTAEAQRRNQELSAQVLQHEAALETNTAERQRLAALTAKLTTQLRAGQETLEATQGRAALEQANIEAERERWQSELAAARTEAARLTAAVTDLHDATAHAEAARAQAAADTAALERDLEAERARRAQVEEELQNAVTSLRAHGERLSGEASTARAQLAERDAQLAQLQQEQDAARLADANWQHTAAGLRAEITALAARLEDSTTDQQRLRDERDGDARQHALIMAAHGEEAQTLTQGLQAAREQVAQLEEERGTLRATLTAAAERASELDAAHTAARAQLQAEAAARRAQVRSLTAAQAEADTRAQRNEQALAVQLQRVDEEAAHAAALAEQCAQLQQSLGTAQAQRSAVSADLAQARIELEALREQSADRGALARQTSVLNNRVLELEQQLTAGRAEGHAAERQRAALAEELDAARRLHTEAQAASEGERATLRAALERLTGEYGRLETEKAALTGEMQEQRAARLQLQGALEQTQLEQAATGEETDRLRKHLGDQQRRLDESIDTLRKQEAAAAELAKERDALRGKVEEAFARLTAIQRLAPVSEAADASTLPPSVPAPASGKDRRGARKRDDRKEEKTEEPGAPLIIERSGPLDTVVESEPSPTDTAAAASSVEAHYQGPATSELVLLDGGPLRDQAGEVLKGAGFEVTLAAPTEGVVDELARRKVKCIMLNLGNGAPAWCLLKGLRERVGTRNIPILAYVMTPEAPIGFCFGRADFAVWPIEPPRLIERLERLYPKIKRLLAVSADVDGMNRLREPLTQSGVSTSIVLDGKQAVEFASMVDPEAAVLHLSPTCGSVARAISSFRSTESTRTLPLLILLDKTNLPAEEAFFSATNRQLLNKATFKFTNLPEEIGLVVG